MTTRPLFFMRPGIALFVGLGATLWTCSASANWTSLPGAVHVSSTRAFSRVATAPDGSQGMFVAWRESTLSATNEPVEVQHVDRNGALAGWTKVIFPGNGTDWELTDATMDICSDGLNGAFVAWGDYEDYPLGFIGFRVWLTHLDASGAVTSGFPVLLNDDDRAAWPAVAQDGMGGVVVSWLDGAVVDGCGLVYTLRAQRVDANGNRLWSPASAGVPVSPSGDLSAGGDFRSLPNDMLDPTGRRAVCSGTNVYLAWPAWNTGCSQTKVKAQQLNIFNGSLNFDLHGLDVYTASSGPTFAYSAPVSGGDCLVTAYASNGELQVSRVTNTGITWTKQLAASSCRNAAAISDGQDGVWVSWYSNLASALYGQDVDANGGLKMTTPGVVVGGKSFEPSDYPPSLVLDGTGGIFVGPSASPGTQFREFLCQGLGYAGGLAFQSGGLEVSSPTQQARAISGCPGGFNNALFAWGNSNGVWAQQVTLSNLDAISTPPNPPDDWAGPLVPRATPDATPSFVALPPPTTLSEIGSTYLNWGVTQDGPNPTASFWEVVTLDGVTVRSVLTPDGTPAGPDLHVNAGPIHVLGGKHTLTLYANWSGIDAATPTADDVYSQQWTWDPSQIAPGPGPGPPPGPYGKFLTPNGNGHKFLTSTLAPGAVDGWVASTAARRGPTYDPNSGALLGYGDSFGLQLYDLPAGSDEFTHQIGGSHQGFNRTNFVLSTMPSLPESLYTLEVRDSAQDANPDSAWFDLEFAGPRQGPAAASQWMNQTMAAGGLVDLYVLNATVRQPVRLSLRRHGDAPDISHLAFEAFAPNEGAVFARGGGLGSQMVSAEVETLTFVATRTGPYLVAIYRTDGSAAASPITYDFASSNTTTLAVPGEGPHVLSFAGATPNPAVAGTEFSYTLPEASPVHLELYDVSGRRIRVLDDALETAGDHRARWDGRDQDGERVGAGLYFARLRVGPRVLMRRFTVLR